MGGIKEYLREVKNIYLKYEIPIIGLGGSTAFAFSAVYEYLRGDKALGFTTGAFAVILGLKSLDVLISRIEDEKQTEEFEKRDYEDFEDLKKHIMKFK